MMNPAAIKKERTYWVIYLIILLVLVSCGKNNKVYRQQTSNTPIQDISSAPATTTPTPAPGTPTTDPGVTTPLQQTINQDMLARISETMTKYPCKNASPRLEFNFHMLTEEAPLATIPVAALQQGSGPSGVISKVYMGIYPNYNDFLVIKDISEGSKIIARNVTLSLCQLNPLIIPERPINIVMATPLNITENPSCVIGNVKGDFYISSQTYGSYSPYVMREVFINFPICQ